MYWEGLNFSSELEKGMSIGRFQLVLIWINELVLARFEL